MPPARKLFLAHAGELAYLLVRIFGRTPGKPGLVTEFIRSYAQRFNRQGLLSNLDRAAEIDSRITREALLATAVDIRSRVPRAFPEDTFLADSFFLEFVASLGRALEWRPSEADAEREAFRRDLELYQHWTRRSPSRSRGAEDSPFPDRCALLLDPAMMEQARRAAAEFEAEILRTGARIFANLGAEARAAKPRRRPKSRVAAKRPATKTRHGPRPRRRAPSRLAAWRRRKNSPRRGQRKQQRRKSNARKKPAAILKPRRAKHSRLRAKRATKGIRHSRRAPRNKPTRKLNARKKPAAAVKHRLAKRSGPRARRADKPIRHPRSAPRRKQRRRKRAAHRRTA